MKSSYKVNISDKLKLCRIEVSIAENEQLVQFVGWERGAGDINKYFIHMKLNEQSLVPTSHATNTV